MTESTGRFNANVETARAGLSAWEQRFAACGLISEYIENASNTMPSLVQVGIDLDSQMHDRSAIAGVTGKTLDNIEGYARDSAKAFGIDASQVVEGYKLLLSQLSPELGKYPDALQAMGNSIATTSKLMGGDGVTAAEVLTTAMNQYGVSLDDPIKASEEMARMMNVMAAAGQEGSAELPAIKVALERCGMAAKAANVSFEETNAAIQVLGKAGKKGSEAGVALCNVLSTLAAGRCLPEKTFEELQKAGINVDALSDKAQVVSWYVSTSNHNDFKSYSSQIGVVSHLASTSNHNEQTVSSQGSLLFLISLLHQTTTLRREERRYGQLFLTLLLHQTTTTSRAIRRR